MGKNDKKTRKIVLNNQKHIKRIVKIQKSSDNENPIWLFDMIDRDGKFAFNLARADFDHKEFLDKLISYTNMTWSEIKKQTHDNGKSKHHMLDYDSLSKDAKDRIKTLRKEDDTDRIFSFALMNKIRIIGLREDKLFHVIWYDSEHGFCPSRKSIHR